MKFLAIETAYDICGAAFFEDEELIALEETVAPRAHNERLAPAVAGMLAQTGWMAEDIEGIALDVGPGSYTGLRIGMSYAKGLAFGLGIRLYPVPALPALLQDEDLGPITSVITFSHGDYVFQAPSAGGTVRAIAWGALTEAVPAGRMAAYLPDRFDPPAGVELVRVCPSAVKVGKFAIQHKFDPAEEPDKLMPDYLHEYQSRPRNHVDQGSPTTGY